MAHKIKGDFLTDHRYLACAFTIMLQHFVFLGCVLMTLVTIHIYCWQRVRLLSIKLDSVVAVYRGYGFGFSHL